MKQDAYSILAPYYDRLTDVNYQEWAAYLEAVWRQFGLRPRRVLELACGTGALTEELLLLGLDVVAVDRSRPMLEQARRRLDQRGGVQLLEQDIRKLSFPRASFDMAVCACDGINYLATEEDLEVALRGIAEVVRPNGLLLFDLNSPWKLQHLYGDQNYAELQEDFGYFWDNQWDEELRQTKMELTFFVPAEQDRYQRITEVHVQRLWTPPEIQKALDRTGWVFLDLFAFPGWDEPEEETERWQIVARRTNVDLIDL